MNESTLDTLTHRPDRLERENRYLKGTGVVVMIVIAGLMLVGQASSSKVVEAERFVVRDASGTILAELGLTTGGFITLPLAPPAPPAEFG